MNGFRFFGAKSFSRKRNFELNLIFRYSSEGIVVPKRKMERFSRVPRCVQLLFFFSLYFFSAVHHHFPVAKVSSSSSVSSDQQKSECEKRVISSFTVAQAKQLCEDAPAGAIGPAICASVAKQVLHAKFEVALELCQGSISAAPAQCMSKLDVTTRNKHGLTLCQGAVSSLPAECYNELVSYAGGRGSIKTDEIISFCHDIEDPAPILCMHAVKSTSLVPLHQALFPCHNAIGSPAAEDVKANFAVADCIEHMKTLFVSSSFGITAADVLKFCVKSNPHAYDTHPFVERDGVQREGEGEDPLKRAKSSSSSSSSSNRMEEEEEEEDIISPPAMCFEVTGSKSFPVTLTAKQRLRLCENALVFDGPVNCTLKASGYPTTYLTATASGSGASSSSSSSSSLPLLRGEDLIDLCIGARNSGPADCFKESRNLGSVKERTLLCNSAGNTVIRIEKYFCLSPL